MLNLNLLASDVKHFLSNETNRVFVLLVISSILIICADYFETQTILKTNAEILSAIEKTEKKVDFRYFNTTKSLEKIHNVEINTQNGRLIKD